MTHQPREWPNVAKDARDRSAEAAVAGIRALEPFCRPDAYEMTEHEVLRRVLIAMNSLQKIARLLESVGAPTRP